MTRYRVHFELRDADYIDVEAESPGEAAELALEGVTWGYGDVEVTDVYEC